jgi:Tfp pilus assembly protein FimT
MTKFLLGFTLALLMVAIVIIAFMAAPNTRPPRTSKRQPVADESKYSEWREGVG